MEHSLDIPASSLCTFGDRLEKAAQPCGKSPAIEVQVTYVMLALEAHTVRDITHYQY